jgi:hypothetical protein
VDLILGRHPNFGSVGRIDHDETRGPVTDGVDQQSLERGMASAGSASHGADCLDVDVDAVHAANESIKASEVGALREAGQLHSPARSNSG